MTTSESMDLITAVIQAIATIVLVGVTIWYVRLTAGILRTSQAQLTDARRLVEASTQLSRNHLIALIAKVDQVVDSLPKGRIPVQHFRTLAMWSESDEAHLIQLAAGAGSAAAEAAAKVGPSLSWLRALHARITATSEIQGYGESASEVRQYLQHLTTAEKALASLRASVA